MPYLPPTERRSHRTGFARFRGDSQYPEAWDGLIAAWLPSLGPTGLKVIDVSGNGLHGQFSDTAANTHWVCDTRFLWELAGMSSGSTFYLQVGNGSTTPSALKPDHITIIGQATANAPAALISCFADDGTTASGWGVHQTGSGTDNWRFMVATTGGRSADPTVPGIGSNIFHALTGDAGILVCRYDGITAAMEGYNPFNGALLGSNAVVRTHGGPISYTVDHSAMIGRYSMVSGGASGMGYEGVSNLLVYNRDIGRELAAAIARDHFTACPRPFIPFKRRFFPNAAIGGSTYNDDVSESLSFSDEADVQHVRSATAADNLTLSDVLGIAGTRSVDASDTLVVTDALAENLHSVSLADSLSPTDALVARAVRNASASESIGLVDGVSGRHIVACGLTDSFVLADLVPEVIKGSVHHWALGQADALAVSDTCRANIRSLSVIEAVSPTDVLYEPATLSINVVESLSTTTTTVDPVTLTIVTTTTGLTDQIATHNVLHRITSDFISMADMPAVSRLKSGAIAVSCADTLVISDGVAKTKLGGFADFLPWSDAFVCDRSHVLGDQLDLLDGINCLHVAGVGAVESVNLDEGFAFFLTRAGLDRRYHPFIGSSAPGAPPAMLMPLSPASVRFQLASLTDPTDYVTLRAPDFGDKDRLGFNRVLRETRGGTLVVFADPQWPKTQTLALNFSGLSQNQAQTLLTFLGNHLGQEVGMTDWEGRQWRGVVMNPDSPVTEDSPGRFAASFQFEGSPA